MSGPEDLDLIDAEGCPPDCDPANSYCNRDGGPPCHCPLFDAYEEEKSRKAGEDAKHAADAEYWTMAATAVGFNELAKMGRTLGEKVYMRLFRDRAEELLTGAGHAAIFARDDAVAGVLPGPPFIKFLASDIELMRQLVKEHDEKISKKAERGGVSSGLPVPPNDPCEESTAPAPGVSSMPMPGSDGGEVSASPAFASECPICSGETDPLKQELRSLCEKHMSELPVLTDEAIAKAVDQGVKDRTAVEDAAGMMPGRFR